MTYTPAVDFTLSCARSCVFYIINNIVLVECSSTQHRATVFVETTTVRVYIIIIITIIRLFEFGFWMEPPPKVVRAVQSM